jgi:hypothetical protein
VNDRSIAAGDGIAVEVEVRKSRGRKRAVSTDTYLKRTKDDSALYRQIIVLNQGPDAAHTASQYLRTLLVKCV